MGDARLTTLGTTKHLMDGGRHTLGIVGVDIEALGASGFLKTGTCAGHVGQTAADGLDDGNAKTFVA